MEIDGARQEALRLATEFVNEQALPKPNERGYRDGTWPDFQARIDYILKVAEWLLRPAGRLVPPPPTKAGSTPQ